MYHLVSRTECPGGGFKIENMFFYVSNGYTYRTYAYHYLSNKIYDPAASCENKTRKNDL